MPRRDISSRVSAARKLLPLSLAITIPDGTPVTSNIHINASHMPFAVSDRSGYANGYLEQESIKITKKLKRRLLLGCIGPAQSI